MTKSIAGLGLGLFFITASLANAADVGAIFSSLSQCKAQKGVPNFLPQTIEVFVPGHSEPNPDEAVVLTEKMINNRLVRISSAAKANTDSSGTVKISPIEADKTTEFVLSAQELIKKTKTTGELVYAQGTSFPQTFNYDCELLK